MRGRSSTLLVDLCTLGYAHFSTAHAQNGDFKPSRPSFWGLPPSHHRPTFWGLPPQVVPSPFPKACYLLMEREHNSLDTSLSTTCSKCRRGSLRRLLCCVCLSLCFHCVCHVLPCVLICRFFFGLYFFACFHTFSFSSIKRFQAEISGNLYVKSEILKSFVYLEDFEISYVSYIAQWRTPRLGLHETSLVPYYRVSTDALKSTAKEITKMILRRSVLCRMQKTTIFSFNSPERDIWGESWGKVDQKMA